MRWGRRSWALVLGTILIAFGLTCCSQTGTDSPIKVLSAKRGKSYTSSPMGQELTATHPQEDVVLVLEIGGISVEEFRKIDTEKLYLMAGERRCNFNVTSSGEINGKPRIKLATIVPRQTLEFKLVVGGYPPKTFKAKDKIYDELD